MQRVATSDWVAGIEANITLSIAPANCTGHKDKMILKGGCSIPLSPCPSPARGEGRFSCAVFSIALEYRRRQVDFGAEAVGAMLESEGCPLGLEQRLDQI